MSSPSVSLLARNLLRLLPIASLAFPLCSLAQSVNLGVNATQTARTAVVDERVFGLNAVMWDGQTGASQTISLLQAAGVRVIRIPGGSASDVYHWNFNKSDMGALPLVLNTWTWSAGFDSFSRLISGLNAQAFVTVNYGSGSPREAAAWVAYANAPANLLGTGADVTIGIDPATGTDWKTAGYWSHLRASAVPPGNDDGMNFLRILRSAPFGIKYWEIGNECYGTWEQDLNTTNGNFAHDPFTYGTRAKTYITMMKAVDPTIKVGVVAVTTEDANSNGYSAHPATNPVTHLLHIGWTPVMLATMNSGTAVLPDFLIYHRYDGAPGAESDSVLLQAAKTWPADVTDLRTQLNSYLGATAGPAVEIDVTENNSVYSNPGKQTTSLVNGLYMADSIGNVLQTELNSLVWWDLRNGQDNAENNSSSLYGWRQYGDYGVLSTHSSFGSSTDFEPYPTYYVMKLLQHFARGGDTIVTTTSSNPLVSIFAAKHPDGSMSLLVINKSPTSAFSATIALTGYSPPANSVVFSYGIPQDTAAQTSVGSPDLAAANFTVSGASFTKSFPAYSASVIVFGAALPAMTTQATAQTVSAGQNATFTVGASGTPAPAYQWQRLAAGSGTWTNLSDGGSYAGTTTATLTVTNTSPTMSGDQFRCIATNSSGSVTSNPASLTVHAGVVDFNGDGNSDLLWQNNSTGERSIWLMSGTSFSSAGSLGVIPMQWQVGATGDFNGDGKSDILWQNNSTGERLVWLMNGTGFVASVSLGVVPTQWSIVATGDFNGDGKSDILWQNNATGERLVWLMNGTSFLSAVSLGMVPTQWVIAGTGDFNGDGKTDIVWQNAETGERIFWLMNGTSFASAASLGVVPTQWWIAGIGDYNADGKPDLIWQNASTGERLVWLMNGTSYQSAVSLGVVDPTWTIGRPSAPSRSTADFNGDGKSDILLQNTSTGERAVWLMDGTNYSANASLGTVPTDWAIAASGDFNGDGLKDILWQNTSTGERAIWLLTGTNYLSSVSLGTVPTAWSMAGTGDFNGDGSTDILWQNSSTGELSLWLMNGSSYVSSVALPTIPTEWSVAGVGDFNGDGQPDIVFQNTSTGERLIWVMNGTTIVTTASLGTVATEWSIVGTGDFNGDGQADLVWQDTSTGDRAIWLMNGTVYGSYVSLGNLAPVWSMKE